MWGIFLLIMRDFGPNGTTNTDFITGFTSKDDADAAAEQIQKDMGGWVSTSVIRIT
jgi:hypothetical protein